MRGRQCHGWPLYVIGLFIEIATAPPATLGTRHGAPSQENAVLPAGPHVLEGDLKHGANLLWVLEVRQGGGQAGAAQGPSCWLDSNAAA